MILVNQDRSLFSDFIVEEETTEPEENSAKVSEAAKEKLDKYIARNIKAELVPHIKGAVKITWDVQIDSNEDFIVGRSMDLPDTADRVLKAISVKVVPAGVKPEIMDSELKPGTYYYCVVAKSKITDREIILYPDQNYTAKAVVIEEENIREPEKILPSQVSLIYAKPITNLRVRLTWRGVEARGIVYTVYRSTLPLDSPAKIVQAEKMKEITDGRESFIDDTISKSGTYYYAVTSKNTGGNEDLNLQPDQSYTVAGVFISLDAPAPVTKISAATVDKSVKITWEKTSSGVMEYLIYRYSNAISDPDRLGLSTFLDRAQDNSTVYYDKNPEAGHYYYAVLTRFQNGKVLNDLVKGANFTLEPVMVGSRIQIQSILAYLSGRDVEITWKTSGDLGNKNYKILRRNDTIKEISDVQKADLIANINAFDHSYIDKNLSDGSYYYAIIPDSVDDKITATLTDGINVSRKVTVSGKAIAKIITPEKMVKKKPDADSSAQVPKIDKREKKESDRSGVDAILYAYFFKGRYKNSLIELENYINNSDNTFENARARLFIGRTYIELKMYKNALRFLALKDVNEKFPMEAQFWRDFILMKIKDEDYKR